MGECRRHCHRLTQGQHKSCHRPNTRSANLAERNGSHPSDTFAQAQLQQLAMWKYENYERDDDGRRREREQLGESEQESESSYQIYGLDSLLKCHRALMQWNEELGLGLARGPPFIWTSHFTDAFWSSFHFIFFFFSNIFNIFMTHISAARWALSNGSCPLFALSLSEWLGFFLAATEIYAFLRLCKPWFFLLAAT